MSDERLIKWETLPGIDFPCADISHRFTSGSPRNSLSVRMHFSRVVDGAPNDLLLVFSKPIALRWHEESFDLERPHAPLPMCSGKWQRWTFPLLRVEYGQWLAQHHASDPPAAQGREEFLLIAMNDVLRVIASPEVEARWVVTDDVED